MPRKKLTEAELAEQLKEMEATQRPCQRWALDEMSSAEKQVIALFDIRDELHRLNRSLDYFVSR